MDQTNRPKPVYRPESLSKSMTDSPTQSDYAARVMAVPVLTSGPMQGMDKNVSCAPHQQKDVVK